MLGVIPRLTYWHGVLSPIVQAWPHNGLQLILLPVFFCQVHGAAVVNHVFIPGQAGHDWGVDEHVISDYFAAWMSQTHEYVSNIWIVYFDEKLFFVMISFEVHQVYYDRYCHNCHNDNCQGSKEENLDSVRG